MVSFRQGRAPASSAKPPQRSTTVSPSIVAQNEAPRSAPVSKFFWKASAAAWNLGSQVPSIVTVAMRVSSWASRAAIEEHPTQDCAPVNTDGAEWLQMAIGFEP